MGHQVVASEVVEDSVDAPYAVGRHQSARGDGEDVSEVEFHRSPSVFHAATAWHDGQRCGLSSLRRTQIRAFIGSSPRRGRPAVTGAVAVPAVPIGTVTVAIDRIAAAGALAVVYELRQSRGGFLGHQTSS